MGLDDGEGRHPVQEAMMMGARFSCDAAEALVDRLLDLKEELIRERDEHNHTDNERIEMTKRHNQAVADTNRLKGLYLAVSDVMDGRISRCSDTMGGTQCVLPHRHEEPNPTDRGHAHYFGEHRGGGAQWG